MKIDKVRKVTIETEDGKTHTFTGIEGSAFVRSMNYVGLGRKNQPYQERLDVSLKLPAKNGVKA